MVKLSFMQLKFDLLKGMGQMTNWFKITVMVSSLIAVFVQLARCMFVIQTHLALPQNSVGKGRLGTRHPCYH
ncbi:hypothetical protein D3C80_2012230 [compost metagenome]